MSRRADVPAGARKRTSPLRKPRVDSVPRNVIAEINAEPVPTASGDSNRAVSTQKAIPRTDVSPVPATSAYALRRMGSRRWVATLVRFRSSYQAAVVIRTGRSRMSLGTGGLVRRPGIDPTYGEVDHEIHRFIRNLVAGHPPHLFVVNEEGQPFRLPVQSKGVPAFSEALSSGQPVPLEGLSALRSGGWKCMMFRPGPAR